LLLSSHRCRPPLLWPPARESTRPPPPVTIRPPTATAWSIWPDRTAGKALQRRFQKPLRSALEHHGREPAGMEGAGVQIHPVGQNLGPVVGRVTVHDELGMKPGMVKKALADPDQVRILLLLQGDTRPDAGMAEEEVPEADGRSKAAQEGQVFLRNGPAQFIPALQ